MTDLSEAQLFPAGHAGHLETDDFEVMAALPAQWDMLCRQVEPGPFQGWMNIVHTDRVQFGNVYWGRGVAIDGLPPPGCGTMMLVLDGHAGARVRGRPVNSTELLALMPSDEIETVMQTGFRLLSVSLPETTLLAYFDAVHGKPLQETDRASRCDLGKEAAVLASRALDLHRLAQSCPEILVDPVQARFFEESLLAAYTQSLAPPVGHLLPHRRYDLARRARAYLHEHAHEPLRLSDLCSALGAPERSLFLAFNEAFGMPPKAYLKKLRLNGARHDLLRAEAGDSVSAIAARWGFLHFGWFSSDYHRQFGEHPSDTLARGLRLG